MPAELFLLGAAEIETLYLDAGCRRPRLRLRGAGIHRRKAATHTPTAGVSALLLVDNPSSWASQHEPPGVRAAVPHQAEGGALARASLTRGPWLPARTGSRMTNVVPLPSRVSHESLP